MIMVGWDTKQQIYIYCVFS